MSYYLIDPNKEILSNNSINTSDYNGMPEYERYNIYAELLVLTKENTEIKFDDKGNLLNFETTKGLRFNLIGANKNNQFTTNYTDTILGNIDSKTEIDEGIGIRNITISINDRYVPKVTIEMVDIRGSVIFNIENSKYKGFFDFPPPLFVLRAKGHYGKPIQMTLQKLKHNIKFDSSSGNYIITADFIGYAFAPLSDVPFAYVKTINMMTQKENYSINIDNTISKELDTFSLIQRTRTLYTDLKVLQESKLSEEINDLTSELEILNSVTIDPTDKKILELDVITKLSTPKEIKNDRIILNLSGRSTTDINTIRGEIAEELTSFYESLRDKDIKPIFTYIDSSNIVIDYSKYNKSLKYKKNETEKNLIEKNIEFEKEKNNITKQILGFEPTVKNVIEILIRDTELFLKELKNSARSQSKNISTFNNVFTNNRIDTFNGYPTVFEQSTIDNNTFEKLIFPGIKQDFSEWGEVKFVNDFITRYREGKVLEDTIKNNSFISTDEAGNKKWLPMNVKDSIENSELNSSFNPYLNFIGADEILDYILTRLIINYNYTFNDFVETVNPILTLFTLTKTDSKGILKVLGEVESINLMNCIPPTKSNFKILQTLKNLLENVKDYNSFLKVITDKKQTFPKTYQRLISENISNIVLNDIEYFTYNDNNFNGILKIETDEPNKRGQNSSDKIMDDFLISSESGYLYNFFKDDAKKSLTDNNLLFIKDENYDENWVEAQSIDSFFLNDKLPTGFSGGVAGGSATGGFGTTNVNTELQIYFKKWDFSVLSGNSIVEAYKFFKFKPSIDLKNLLQTPAILQMPLVFLDYLRNNQSIYKLSSTDLNIIDSYLTNNEDLNILNEEFLNLKSIANNYFQVSGNRELSTDASVNNFFNDKSIAKSTFLKINRIGLTPQYLYNASNNTFLKDKTSDPQTSYKGINQMFSSYNVEGDDNPINTFFNSFKAKFNSLFKTKEDEIKNTSKTFTQSLEEREEIQLECYKSFKRIYERWLVGEQANTIFTDTASINNMFKYIRRNYTDASDIIISLEPLLSFDENTDVSIYSVIAKLLEENNFSFFPLQTFIDTNSQNKETFTENFRIYDKFTTNDFPPPAFICMYIGGFSENDKFYNPNNPNGDKYAYADFGKSDLDTQKLGLQVPIDFQSQSGSTNIPIFLINYGQQNQSVFKSFDFDTSEFKETNESIKYLDLLYANKDNSAPVPKANNLLNIYGARAYSTTVNMVGNLTIQPTMYCQINHVPLYNGGYIILNVEHTITPNKVDTKFKCTRIPLFVTAPVTTSTMKGLTDNNQISNPTIGLSNQSLYFLTEEEKLIFFETRESINTPEKAGGYEITYFSVGATIKDIRSVSTDDVLKKLKNTISKRVLTIEKETLKNNSTPNAYKFANILGKSESSNKYTAKSTSGLYYGRYQIGKGLLEDAFSTNNYNTTKKLLKNTSVIQKIDIFYKIYQTTKKQGFGKIDMDALMFDNDKTLEKQVQDTLFLMCLRVNYNYLFNQYKADISPLLKTNNLLGIEVSKMGLLAATWLTGIGTVRKFSQDANKNFKPKIMIGVDGNLTPLTVYLEFITLGKSFDITTTEINNLLSSTNIDIPILI
jgi:hypothetical protein